MKNRFYFDELYEKTVLAGQEGAAKAADAFDRWIVSGLCVGGAHGATELFGRVLRLMQTGNLQTYAFFFVAGVVLVLYWAMGK
jgi:NADH:ubiquinone oxidoreductase subunit 5 (subunit L)/multisubunit Na+/H+ antiporter MnhA subunit